MITVISREIIYYRAYTKNSFNKPKYWTKCQLLLNSLSARPTSPNNPNNPPSNISLLRIYGYVRTVLADNPNNPDNPYCSRDTHSLTLMINHSNTT